MGVQIKLLKDHPHLRPEPGEIEREAIEGEAVDDDLSRLDRLHLIDTTDKGALTETAGLQTTPTSPGAPEISTSFRTCSGPNYLVTFLKWIIVRP